MVSSLSQWDGVCHEKKRKANELAEDKFGGEEGNER